LNNKCEKVLHLIIWIPHVRARRQTTWNLLRHVSPIKAFSHLQNYWESLFMFVCVFVFCVSIFAYEQLKTPLITLLELILKPLSWCWEGNYYILSIFRHTNLLSGLLINNPDSKCERVFPLSSTCSGRKIGWAP